MDQDVKNFSSVGVMRTNDEIGRVRSRKRWTARKTIIFVIASCTILWSAIAAALFWA